MLVTPVVEKRRLGVLPSGRGSLSGSHQACQCKVFQEGREEEEVQVVSTTTTRNSQAWLGAKEGHRKWAGGQEA